MVLVTCGCGTGPAYTTGLTILLSDCDSGVRKTLDAVVLDWDGGTSPLLPDAPFDGIDLGEFQTSGGGTLADVGDNFKEAVRSQVARILCDLPIAPPRVTNGKALPEGQVSVVQIADIHSPQPGQIGKGEYDPCDQVHDNSAIIFGTELKLLGRTFSYDEWVNIFANVTAHEIAHGLGYAHAPRVDDSYASDRSLYVELMYATHTVDEMIREQRLVADMSNCESDSAQGKISAKVIEPCQASDMVEPNE
ncbi:MAG: hypothetical protein HY287_11580 [Planctomycetes bacterium]|nr:hypothetical protein [Planctomycetota bacterium]